MISYRDHLIPFNSSIKQALVQLNKLGRDAIIFMVDKEDKLMGSITDGDVRRGLLKGISIEMPVNDIISVNPKFIRKGEDDINRMIEYREANYRIIPVLDTHDRVVNVINFRHIRSYLPVDVVIMAGGRGQRLAPITDSIPKPLLMVGEKPIIEHNLERLSLFGVETFWISVNYLGEQIENYFGNGADRNIQISYVWENQPLGTIGAVSKIKNFQHEYVLITNSDILTNLDYEHFFLEFIKRKADMAIVSIPYQVTIPYAVLETDDGLVVNFKEKPSYTYYSNGGIYLIKRHLLDLLPSDAHFNATDLMERLIKDGKNVFSYPLMCYWLDIGNPDDYSKAQIDIENIKF